MTTFSLSSRYPSTKQLNISTKSRRGIRQCHLLASSACPRQKQIGGITIDQGNTLDEQIVADEHRQKIEKEIAKLEKQARTEKQPKKKFELVQRVKALKKQIKELNG